MLLIIPCDHIYNTDSLIESINKGIESNNEIITFGIKPTYPETGFGYIEKDGLSNKINRFIEKPKIEIAEKIWKQDNIYWNSGIFLLEPYLFFSNLLLKYQAKMFDVIQNLNNEINIESDTIKFINIDSNFITCENISIDYGIMELLDPNKITMIEYNDIWNDIGSFKSIYDICNKDNSFINTNTNCINLNSDGCYINSDKLVLLNNVENLSIVNTTDVLLISDINKSQEVKKLYELAKTMKKNEINYSNIDYRPWGFYEVLAGGDNMGFKIKRIVVYSNKKLSLQSHNHRKEYWFCLKGKGVALIENNNFVLESTNNTSVFIDIRQKHRLINDSNDLLEIIEIQLGTYLGEDDIIRYEDDYNRV